MDILNQSPKTNRIYLIVHLGYMPNFFFESSSGHFLPVVFVSPICTVIAKKIPTSHPAQENFPQPYLIDFLYI